MKIFGMLQGNKTGKDYLVSKDQVIEAPDGEFHEDDAYIVERKSVSIAGEDVETAAMEPKVERRGRKPKNG